MPARRFAPALGLILLIAAVLPFRIWRASLETSLWIDETASLVLSGQSTARIVDMSAVDTNPPGYYLLLKAWLKLGRILGLEPGILWARLLGVLAWVLLAVVTWSLGNRLFGPLHGTVLTVAVAASSYSGVLANDARGYGIASVALFACFLILLRSYEEDVVENGQAPGRVWTSAGRWLLYAACATAALWTHVLSLLVLGCLALLGLGLLVRAKAWTSRFFRFGIGAHLVTALLFLPWLIRLTRQVAGLQASAPTWMTPPTWLNLSTVFWYWFPFGRVGVPEDPPPLFPLLGLLSVLVPLAAVIWSALRTSGEEERSGRLGLLAGSGLAISCVFVTLLWLLQRLGLAAVFYAPRYPALSAAFWAAGLTGMAGFAGARCRSKGLCTWGLIAPWILCAVLGQSWVPRIETQGGLRAALLEVTPAPPPGSPLYVLPSELIPFYRKTLSGYRVRRIESLPCELSAAGTAEGWVLNLNFWHLFDRPRDLIVQRLLDGGTLSGATESAPFPLPAGDYKIYHLTSIRRDAAAALCREGIQPAGRAIPRAALSVALPEEQRYTDGWSFPEVSTESRLYRWASVPSVAVRFDRPLPAGDYVVHYQGYRSALPRDPAAMAFRFAGTSYTAMQANGEILVQLRAHLDGSVRHPVLVVEHPLWSPAASGSPDSRSLASAFFLAWVEPATP